LNFFVEEAIGATALSQKFGNFHQTSLAAFSAQ